uniref:Uncharacterized protein n=1 Tax=Panagrolaimus sp. ES5 TaxID=591445 RepID=A0AC34GPI3_9BILA
MKLLLVFGICLILSIQTSHQLPLGTKDLLRPRFPNRDDQKAIFNDVQNKRLGKYWKTHGIRSVKESDVVAKEKPENEAPLVGVPSDFDHLEVGVITDNVNKEIKPGKFISHFRN